MKNDLSDTTKELMELLPKYAPNDDFVRGTLLMVQPEEERKIILDMIKNNPNITSTEISYATIVLRRKRKDSSLYRGENNG